MLSYIVDIHKILAARACALPEMSTSQPIGGLTGESATSRDLLVLTDLKGLRARSNRNQASRSAGLLTSLVARARMDQCSKGGSGAVNWLMT